MYYYCLYENDRGGHYFLRYRVDKCLVPTPKPSPADRKKVDALFSLIAPKLPEGADEKEVRADLATLVFLLGEIPGRGKDHEFGAWMLLVHMRLDPALKNQRAEVFRKSLELSLGSYPQLDEDVTRKIGLYLKIIPDSNIEPFGRDLAGGLKMLGKVVTSESKCIDLLIDRCSGLKSEILSQTLILAVLHGPLDETQKRAAYIQKAVQSDLALEVISHWMGADQNNLGLYPPVWSDALCTALEKYREVNKVAQLPVFLREASIYALNEVSAYDRLTVRATFDAWKAGLDFGPFAPHIARASDMFSNLWARLVDQYDKAALDRTEKGKVPQPKPDEIDPAYNWPIGKLVEWINGPVSEPEPKPAQELVASSARGRGANAGRGRNPKGRGRAEAPKADKGPVSHPRPAFSEVHTEGLRRYAAYLLADLRDMCQLCKPFKIGSDLLSKLEVLTKQVEDTAKRTDPDRDIARSRFAEADALIAKLREVLKKEKAGEDFDRSFKTALHDCVKQAPLAFGRNFGGKIECPARAQDWGSVYDTYHNVWLQGIDEIFLDNQPMKLGGDQALAYYVTGSSNSGYAFCVSVHLWRRRGGSTAAPVAGDSSDGRMDAANWMDTRIPCGVFHVPARK